MKTWAHTTRFAGTLIVGIAPILLSGCFGHPAEIAAKRAEAAFAKGSADASAAIAAGQLALKQYPPLPSPPGHAEYLHLLQQRCGVVTVSPKLPAGIHTEDFMQEVNGWNQVMIKEIQRQFGAEIFAQLWDEAQRQFAAGAANQGLPASAGP